ncbi:MAG: hypothetical protein QM773_21585, partial [Hyphomonadaceae bacterium]
MGTNKFWRALSTATVGALAALALQACGGPSAGTNADVVMGKDQGPQLETRKSNSPRATGSKEFEF